jgi:hypothetical protein
MGGPPGSPHLLRPGDGPFVGRDAELRNLVDVLASVEAGDRRLVELSGVAGAGKTSVLAHLAAHAAERGFAVLYGGAQDGPAAPYQPIVEAIRAHEAAVPSLRLHGRTEPLGALFPELADASVDDTVGDGFERRGPDTELGRRPLFDGFVALLADLAAATPLLLVLDDIHWASATTLDLVRHIALDTRATRLLVVTAHRTGEAAASSVLGGHLAELRRADAAGSIARVEVGDLSEAAVRELVDELGGTRSLADGVLASTEGNALLVTLALQQLLGSQGDAERATIALGDIVDARLQRLSDGARELVELAAVAGPQTPSTFLQAATGAPERFLDDLDEAIAAGLVAEEDGLGLRFIHDLVRQRVLAGQLDARRRLRHRRLATVLAVEPIAPDLYAVAFHHAAAGEDPAAVERTAALAERAARTAIGRLAPAEAAELARRGLALLADQPAADRSALLATLADALHLTHDVHELNRVVFDALDAAAESGDAALAARVCLHFRELLVIGEQARAAIDHCRSALDGLGEREPALRAEVLATMATLLALSDDAAAAPAIADEAVSLARASGDDASTGRALVSAYVAAWGTPAVDGQIAIAREAYALGLASGDTASAVYALRNEGVAHLAAGDRATFEATWAELRRIGAAAESRAIAAMDQLWSGTVALLEGRWEDAEAAGRSTMELLPGDENISAGVMAQTLWAGLERGTAGGMAPIVQALGMANPGMLVYPAIHGYLLSEDGDSAGALAALSPITADNFAAIAHDWLRPAMYAFVADAVVRAADRDLAAALVPLVEPYAGQLAVAATATMVTGAFDRHIGALHHLVGETGAPERLEAALALERQIGAPPLQARTLLVMAELLDDAGAAAEAETLATKLSMAAVAARARQAR